MKIYCPECKSEMKNVGITGCGKIYVCCQCDSEWVIEKSGKITVRFHKTGAVSIDNIRYGPDTEIARFFTDLKTEKKKEEKDIHDYRVMFPNGMVVTHIRGGRGKIKTLENDWETDPPTVIALVQVMDTAFPNIRRIPVKELKEFIDSNSGGSL